MKANQSLYLITFGLAVLAGLSTVSCQKNESEVLVSSTLVPSAYLWPCPGNIENPHDDVGQEFYAELMDLQGMLFSDDSTGRIDNLIDSVSARVPQFSYPAPEIPSQAFLDLSKELFTILDKGDFWLDSIAYLEEEIANDLNLSTEEEVFLLEHASVWRHALHFFTHVNNSFSNKAMGELGSTHCLQDKMAEQMSDIWGQMQFLFGLPGSWLWIVAECGYEAFFGDYQYGIVQFSQYGSDCDN